MRWNSYCPRKPGLTATAGAFRGEYSANRDRPMCMNELEYISVLEEVGLDKELYLFGNKSLKFLPKQSKDQTKKERGMCFKTEFDPRALQASCSATALVLR